MLATQTAFLAIGLRLFFGFEFRAVKEFENFHYGWYCSLTMDVGEKTEAPFPKNLYDEKFENVFLSSMEIDEIRDQVDDLLETEDEEDEYDQNTTDPEEDHVVDDSIDGS